MAGTGIGTVTGGEQKFEQAHKSQVCFLCQRGAIRDLPPNNSIA
jgi:hypothetical protein